MARKKAAKLQQVIPQTQPLKLDLGCGKNKQPGFIGVDAIGFEGVVDVQADLTEKWPWPDESVDEIHSSHFVEHLTPPQRVLFWNEIYRVLKWGCIARVIAPHWSNSCAYGDPTHQWPPISEWTVQYIVKAWRDVNAPHTNSMLNCDFDVIVAGSWEPWLEVGHQEKKIFSMQHYTNSYRDIIFTLTKTKRG